MSPFTVLKYWRSYSHFKVVAAVLFMVIGLVKNSEGIRMCYHCDTKTHGLTCAQNPRNVTDGEISCKGYCTIRRKEYAYMPSYASLVSLQRTCEMSPAYLDEVALDGYFKYYFRSCKNYLCNVGAGIESLKEIPMDPSWDLYPDEDSDTDKGYSIACSRCFVLAVAVLLILM